MRRYPLDPALATQLAERRRRLGLTQNQVALAAGLTEGAISKYERLAYGIPPEALEGIERALSRAEAEGLVPA